MLRPPRRPVLLIALAGLLVGLLPATATATSPLTPEQRRIVDFWTPARMAAAIPRDFVRTPGGFVPAKKPGGGTDSGTVTGATWTAGGLVLQATGKVYFRMDGSGWICSGSVIADQTKGRSYVLTAGHCAYDETNGAFATDWLFIPDFMDAPTYTCAQTKYGCWTADALVVHAGFATAGAFNTQATLYDFAVAVVGGGSKNGGDLSETVGGYPIGYPAATPPTAVYAFGYPAAGRYHGAKLTYCAGPTFTDRYNEDLTWGLSCTMTGGSSGGPWFANFDASTTNGTLTSLNSYGYNGISAMFGPLFDDDTQAVVQAAQGASANTIVGQTGAGRR